MNKVSDMKKSGKPDPGYGLSTIAVHSGEEPRGAYGPGTTPIYQTATFQLTDAVYKAMQGGHPRDELIYSRYDNPTCLALERKLAALEGAEDALVFSSGMAAISVALETFLKAGDRLVCAEDLYGGVRSLVVNRFPTFGIEVELVPTTDNAAWKRALSRPTRLVYCEGISNPLLRVADLEVIANFAHRAGALAVIDNTFATPVNSKPLEHGFDIVVHSATKYLGGHTDLIAGSLAGRRELVGKCWDRRMQGGACLDPHTAFLVERGVKTLVLRMKAQNANAAKVAAFLSRDARVEMVSYPGLESHPQHELAARQLSGFGGMVAFALPSAQKAISSMRNLKLIKEATSLGGVESVISMPINTSHARLTEAELRAAGIRPGTLRLSCGIEDVEDLIADLDQAMN